MGHHHAGAVFALLACLAIALLPLPVGAPLAALLVAAGAAVIWQALTSLRAPVITGREGLVGGTARVVAADRLGWQVQHAGELWSARALDDLQPGEAARIVGVDGLKLVVVREDRHAPRELRALAEAQRATNAAATRLEWQAAALERAAEGRLQAARSALPGNEAAARAYLAQRAALLAEQKRLQRQAADLRADVERLASAMAAGARQG